MKAVLIVFSLQLVFIYVGVKGLEIGSLAETCKAKDPNLIQCVKETGQKIIPLIADGVKEWNIPSLDPMYSESAVFTQDNSNAHIKIEYKNVIQTGLSKAILEGVAMDLDNGKMEFKLRYPIYAFEADYDANGELYGFHVEGVGKANITVWDSLSDLKIKFHVENDHIIEDSVTVDYTFDKIFLDYSNLKINNDEELSKSAGTFINENALMILNGFKTELENYYADLTRGNLKGFFQAVPFSVLFRAG